MTSKMIFQPQRGSNVSVTPSATSASININPESKSIRLVNQGAEVCYVRWGLGIQAATVNDFILRANSEVYVRKGDGENTIAYLSPNGTTLHIQTGDGGF